MSSNTIATTSSSSSSSTTTTTTTTTTPAVPLTRRNVQRGALFCLHLLVLLGLWTSNPAKSVLPNLRNIQFEKEDEGPRNLLAMHPNQTTSTLTTATIAHNKYAYAFMYWDMNPNKSIQYRFALTHFMISARLLHGPYKSSADVIVVLKVSDDYEHDTLPEQDEELLRSEGIIVHYMSKSDPENHIPSFNLSQANSYRRMLQKFYLYRLDQYRRIFYLDADVLLHRNLDYWMELSDQGIFGEQVVMAGYTEPANGGAFVLTPGQEQWKQVRRLIEERGTTSDKLWNRTLGWGHVIQSPDAWHTNFDNGTSWNFFAASVDQGLLYHFCKYERRNCTHILSTRVYDYRPGIGGSSTENAKEPVITETPWKQSVLANITMERYFPFHSTIGFCFRFSQGHCVAPYSDMTHWTGISKPWKQGFPSNPMKEWKEIPKSARELWWHMFFTLQVEHETIHPESTWFRDLLPPGYFVYSNHTSPSASFSRQQNETSIT